MTYTDVMATTEALDLAQPAEAAAAVDALNDTLAASARVPAGVGDGRGGAGRGGAGDAA